MRLKTILTTTIASGIAIGCMVPAAIANAATLPETNPQLSSSSTIYKGVAPRAQYMIKTEKDGNVEYYPTPLFVVEPPFDALPLEGPEPTTVNLPEGAKTNFEVGYKKKDKPYDISVGLATTKSGDREVIISGTYDKSPWKVSGGAVYGKTDTKDNQVKLSAEYTYGPFRIIESVGPTKGNKDYTLTSQVKYAQGNWVIGGGLQSPLNGDFPMRRPLSVKDLLGGVAYKSGNDSAYAQYTPVKVNADGKVISGGYEIGGTYNYDGVAVVGKYNEAGGPQIVVNYQSQNNDNSTVQVSYNLVDGLVVNGEIKDSENPNASIKVDYNNKTGLDVNGKVGSWDTQTQLKKIPVEIKDPADPSKTKTIEVPASVNVVSYDGTVYGGKLKAGIEVNASYGKNTAELEKQGKLHLGVAAGNISYEKGNYSGSYEYSMKPSKITVTVAPAATSAASNNTSGTQNTGGTSGTQNSNVNANPSSTGAQGGAGTQGGSHSSTTSTTQSNGSTPSSSTQTTNNQTTNNNQAAATPKETTLWEWTPNSSTSFSYKNGTTVYGVTSTQASSAKKNVLTKTDSLEFKIANQGSANSTKQGASLTFSKDTTTTFTQSAENKPVKRTHKTTLSTAAKYNYGNWEFFGKESVSGKDGKHEKYIIGATYKSDPMTVTAQYNDAHGFGINGEYKTKDGTTFSGKYNIEGVSEVGVDTTFLGTPVSVKANYTAKDGLTLSGGIPDSGWYFKGQF